MRALRLDRRLLYVLIAAYGGMAFSLAAMALPNPFQTSTVPMLKYYTGTLFWTFTATAIVVQSLLTVRHRKRLRRKRSDTRFRASKERVGLLSFPRTIAGLVSLSVFAVSVAVCIFLWLFHASAVSRLINMAVMLLSLCLHGVFDGKLWNEICRKPRRTAAHRSQTEEKAL